VRKGERGSGEIGEVGKWELGGKEGAEGKRLPNPAWAQGLQRGRSQLNQGGLPGTAALG
jgi:hypothetical protein